MCRNTDELLRRQGWDQFVVWIDQRMRGWEN
jgi:hypothetical protein